MPIIQFIKNKMFVNGVMVKEYSKNRSLNMKLRLAEMYLSRALGGNLNISTLKLKFWYGIMNDYAKYYHNSQPCEHPFASVMSKCNGETNECLKCGEQL